MQKLRVGRPGQQGSPAAGWEQAKKNAPGLRLPRRAHAHGLLTKAWLQSSLGLAWPVASSRCSVPLQSQGDKQSLI